MVLASSSKLPGQESDRLQFSKEPQRFAYLPTFVSEEDLEKGDPLFRRELLGAIEDNKAEKWGSGYIYPDIACAETIFIQGKGYFLNDPSWDLDLKHYNLKAQIRYCAVVVRYETDSKGNIIELPENRRPILSDGTKVPFDYGIRFLTLTVKQLGDWRKHWNKEYNPCSTDFTATKGEKQNDSTTFSPNKVCHWRNYGDRLVEQILRDGRARLREASNQICRKMDLDRFKEEILGISHEVPPSAEDEKKYGSFMS